MLPLMPGSEPVQAPVVRSAIAPRQAAVQSSYDQYTTSEATTRMLEGCNCESCQRELARLHDVQQRIWMNAAQDVPASFNWDMPVIKQAYGGLVGTVTGRTSSADPQPANLPRAAPPTLRIRGRYDFSQPSQLHGAVRWLDLRTGNAYETEVSTLPMWTFTKVGFEWTTCNTRITNACRFIPDEV